MTGGTPPTPSPKPKSHRSLHLTPNLRETVHYLKSGVIPRHKHPPNLCIDPKVTGGQCLNPNHRGLGTVHHFFTRSLTRIPYQILLLTPRSQGDCAKTQATGVWAQPHTYFLTEPLSTKTSPNPFTNPKVTGELCRNPNHRSLGLTLPFCTT